MGKTRGTDLANLQPRDKVFCIGCRVNRFLEELNKQTEGDVDFYICPTCEYSLAKSEGGKVVAIAGNSFI